MRRKKKAAPTNYRHERDCRVCRSPAKDAIEAAFVSWKSPRKIARQFKIRSVTTIYLHARAFDLFAARNKNIHALLGNLIEKSLNVRRVSVSAALQAVSILVKLNADGEEVHRSENATLKGLWARMSRSELEYYAVHSKLPAWFEEALRSTSIGSTDNRKEVD